MKPFEGSFFGRAIAYWVLNRNRVTYWGNVATQLEIGDIAVALPIGVRYSSQHQASPVPRKLRLSAQNRSILGGYFQKIRPTCNQRLAAPCGETFLGGTH